MTIFVTKHAMQRRPNARVFEEKTIKLWMQYFIEKFNIIWMTKNGLYTINQMEMSFSGLKSIIQETYKSN